MRLYVSARAPNPRRVRWLMAEKGIEDIELETIDLIEGGHRQPDFLARAGIAEVPVLVLDDGTAISESIAICRYLESLHPEPNLFGRDPREAALIEMWSRRAELMLANPLMLAVRHTHPALAALERQVPEIARGNRAAAERALDLFERRLAHSEYIATDRPTIADIVAIAGLDFARLVQFRPGEGHPHVTRWMEAMRARPAAAAGA